MRLLTTNMHNVQFLYAPNCVRSFRITHYFYFVGTTRGQFLQRSTALLPQHEVVSKFLKYSAERSS